MLLLDLLLLYGEPSPALAEAALTNAFDISWSGHVNHDLSTGHDVGSALHHLLGAGRVRVRDEADALVARCVSPLRHEEVGPASELGEVCLHLVLGRLLRDARDEEPVPQRRTRSGQRSRLALALGQTDLDGHLLSEQGVRLVFQSQVPGLRMVEGDIGNALVPIRPEQHWQVHILRRAELRKVGRDVLLRCRRRHIVDEDTIVHDRHFTDAACSRKRIKSMACRSAHPQQKGWARAPKT
mmetsp:Transcript_108932/g.274130  ORF Transcript_108932/g.274130 Transcript_108932/m.274130 type:complete len:240 (+) Transcript_108932:662-1381(+)